MNEIITIDNVRAYIDENGTAQLNLLDCAKGLGFTEKAASGNETIRWRTVRAYLSNFGVIATSCDAVPQFIPENIFFRLAMKAKNEVAEKFQIVVCDEILPQIRKTGSYNLVPKTFAEALRLAANQAEQIEKQKLQLEEAKPKTEFFDAVAGSKDAIEIASVAKVLGISGMGRDNLFAFLRDKKILMSNNQPYQKYVDAGYFRVLEQKYNKPNGDTCISIKTLVFQKGVDYIRKMVINNERKL